MEGYPGRAHENYQIKSKQYQRLLSFDDVALEFDSGALDAIAERAIERKTGARGLRSIIEEVMMDVMFEIPSENKKEYKVTLDYAKMQLEKANMARLQTA